MVVVCGTCFRHTFAAHLSEDHQLLTLQPLQRAYVRRTLHEKHVCGIAFNCALT